MAGDGMLADSELSSSRDGREKGREERCLARGVSRDTRCRTLKSWTVNQERWASESIIASVSAGSPFR